jgi:hypothetical protein
MCPGVDSAFKNEYQDTLGGKDGRCHLHAAESQENPEPEPTGTPWATSVCRGTPLLFFF